MRRSTLGWRILVVLDQDELRLRQSQLVLRNKDEETEIPLDQIRQLLVMSPNAMISAALMTELTQRLANVILCDAKRTPVCELYGYGVHH